MPDNPFPHINILSSKPVECAWQWILNDRLDLETTSYVREIFDDSDFLETRQFSVLHKIVLGLLPSKDLAVDLQASTAQIDDVDVSGRTCMSWAAARSDLKSVETLLAHRAKLDKCDNSGSYPLHYAALAQDPCCIQVLLDHHAEVDCKNAHGGTPLHMASRGDDERFIIPLLEAGADINAGGSENETALMAAVRNGRLKTAKLLLDRGADANAKTIWGVTALVLCVIYGNPAMLEFLLSRPEVDVLSTDINGRTVLHHAASHGIVENVAVLLKDGLRGIDIDAEDSDEITVWDLLEKRGLEELTTLFEAIREDEEKELSVIITVDASI
jgi:ankyrin repeat protein